jgi:hypothetical protein
MRKLQLASWVLVGSCCFASVVLGAVEPFDHDPTTKGSNNSKGFHAGPIGKFQQHALSFRDSKTSDKDQKWSSSSIFPIDFKKSTKSFSTHHAGKNKLGRRYGVSSKEKDSGHSHHDDGDCDPPPGGVVPEPASLLIWSLLGCAYLLRRFRRRSA